jgi:hypothetical protein
MLLMLRTATTLTAVFAVVCLVLTGCADQRDRVKKAAGQAKGHVHDHPEKGPHDGALAEWGDEEYHAEFTVDHAKSEATVYVLDGKAAKAVPIDAESVQLTLTNVSPVKQIALKAAPQEGDPKGKASRFVGTDPALAKEMEFKGEISGKVNGTPYAGKFVEEAHDHDHKKK